MSLPSTDFEHLTVSEILPEQDFETQGNYSQVKGQIKVIAQHCTPIQCLYQVSTSYTLECLRYSLHKLSNFENSS